MLATPSSGGESRGGEGSRTVPALLLLLPIAEKGFHLGRWIRGGDTAVAVSTGLDGLRASPWLSAFVLVAILGGFVSAIATTLLWWMTSLPGWVGQFSPEGMVYGGLLLFALFSADAWRRWG
jgi:hypothetical protein